MVEWHPGNLYPRVGLDPLCGSSVTSLGRPAERVVAFYNRRGPAAQHIKEGKNAIRWTRLSRQKSRDIGIRLRLLRHIGSGGTHVPRARAYCQPGGIGAQSTLLNELNWGIRVIEEINARLDRRAGPVLDTMAQ